MAKISLPKSSITGKATTATARALAKVKTDLEIKMRKLLDKKELTDADKKELADVKKQLRDVRAEMADESTTAGRKMQQSARDKKMKGKITLPQTPFNKGGMPSRKGNFDMRKGGMFAK